MDYSFDTGSNLTGLAYTFLVLKYLLPVVIVIILIAVGYHYFKKLTKQENDPFQFQIDQPSSFKPGLLISIVVVLLLLLILTH